MNELSWKRGLASPWLKALQSGLHPHLHRKTDLELPLVPSPVRKMGKRELEIQPFKCYLARTQSGLEIHHFVAHALGLFTLLL
jgi:hypothetical protein